MRKIFSVAALIASLFIVSCKKDKNNVGNPSSPSVQKKLKETTYDENWKFSYLDNGSLKEMSLSNDYKQTFIHSANSVQVMSFSNGKINAKGVFTLSNGKPVKLGWTNFNANGQPINTTFETFEYNAKGLLQKRVYPFNSFETYEYDGNDNVIRITHHDDQGVANYKTEITYGNQKDLFPQYGYLSSNSFGFIFPPLSKYLPTSKIETDIANNYISYHSLVSYELDADGYVIKGHAISQVPNVSDAHWTNTY
ncbi:MAG TPA: hypothetical protein VHM26_08985 [Chitinophagaceae bacterium]|jgi:YD repeat-containing protein|nr:hypothetical protein [Chitinophagaceae bacterium]